MERKNGAAAPYQPAPARNGRNGGRNGRGARRAQPTRPTAGQRLVTQGRSDLHEAGLDLFDFFQTMLNPEDLPPQRIPDNHGAMSAVFKTPFVVDLPYSGVWNPETSSTIAIDEMAPVNGYSEVILVPGSTDCYFHTLGVEAPLIGNFTELGNWIPMMPVLATHPVGTDIVVINSVPFTALAQGLRVYNSDAHTDTVADGVAILPKLNSEGLFVYEVEIEAFDAKSPDIVIALGFHNRGIGVPNKSSAIVKIWVSDGSVQLREIIMGSYCRGNDSLLVQNAGGYYGFVQYDFTIPIGETIVGFAVSVRDMDPASHWVFSMTLFDGTMIAPARSATAFKVVSAPELGDLSETQSERTSALTGLLTYMGSTLQDGGQVAAARLGMGLSPLRSFQGDVYSTISSLPFYNDDFALRDGIFAWWLPDSVQEHFYVPYRDPRSDLLEENSAIQIVALRDNPEQAVRLKVVQNLEVITRSRLYTSETGPINPAYSTVIAAIKTIPAVTINSAHIGILRRAMNGVRSWLSKKANWKMLLSRGSSILTKLMPGSLPARALGGLSALVG